jgi:hypothetical protein
MKEKLKVHAFGVKVFDGSGDLEDLLTQIENDSLAARVRSVGYVDLRIEDVSKVGGFGFLILVNFVSSMVPGRPRKVAP